MATVRHTFASRAAMKGWSIVEIAQQGGWKEEQYKEWREDIKKHPEKVGKLHITEDSFTFEFNDKNKKK